MSAFSRQLERWRVKGHPESKIYFDAPITLRPSHLTDIEDALRRGSSGQLRLFVDEREVAMDSYGHQMSVVSALQQSRTYDEIRKISIQSDRVHVYIARAASASSVYADNDSQGVLWAVNRTFQSARWRFGSFLFRTWGAAIAVVTAFLVVLFGFDVQPVAARSAAAYSMAFALLLYLLVTLFVGIRRRVRLDLRMSHEKKKPGSDLVLQGVAIPILILFVNSIWPLVISSWSSFVTAITY